MQQRRESEFDLDPDSQEELKRLDNFRSYLYSLRSLNKLSESNIKQVLLTRLKNLKKILKVQNYF